MNDSFGPGFDTSKTAGGGAGAPSQKRPEGITPMFIKQILSSPESGVKLYDFNIGIVTMVALVRSIDHSSTKISYTLEDHTGQIEGHLWIDDTDSLQIPPIVVNTYNRVYGSVRSRGPSEKSLMLFKVEPISSINELNTFMLEVLNARYLAEKYAKSADDNLPSTNTIGNGMFQQNQPQNDANNPNGLSKNQFAVFCAIRQHADEKGIHINDIRKRLPQMSEYDVKSTIEFLNSEGHIYSSIDSEHFLICE